MFLSVRFLDKSGDQIDQQIFEVDGQSSGWTGSPNNTPLVHRQETLTVPPKTSRLWVVISSAGPPATVGIYIVANLVVSKLSEDQQPLTIMRYPFGHQQLLEANSIPPGWTRDGTHPSMAKIIQTGEASPLTALAIEDDDVYAHAEWRNTASSGPEVTPGDRLLIEWDEAFSVGVADFRSYTYTNLPPGRYRFIVDGLDLMGKRVGITATANVFVPPPLWKNSWFLGAFAVFAIVLMLAGVRFLVWRRVQREMALLKNKQALESERLRIAQDIHDDLGSRVTQISLMSAMFLNDHALSEKTRSGFEQIKQMSQDLISSLSETVWAVNPEYDNLAALGDYLCQLVNQLCEKTDLRVRLQVQDLPPTIYIPSHVRHHIIVVVKEAVHNVIKHANATEVVLHMSFHDALLEFSIQDNGCGFPPRESQGGNGLANIKRRVQDLGGSCSTESDHAHGTIVRVQINIKNPDHE